MLYWCCCLVCFFGPNWYVKNACQECTLTLNKQKHTDALFRHHLFEKRPKLSCFVGELMVASQRTYHPLKTSVNQWQYNANNCWKTWVEGILHHWNVREVFRTKLFIQRNYRITNFVLLPAILKNFDTRSISLITQPAERWAFLRLLLSPTVFFLFK